jgi:glyoxylase-like metal-dependent hydrolase (beta-lactamase superfamily II)
MLQTLSQSNIFTVDALYYEPELASIHLVRSKDRIAVIDTGTQYSVPQVKSALDQLGLSFANVDLVILTHIHLDHAGGASALMNLCDNAQLVVHPKGARHMADPAKLIAGATAVYGEDEFQKLYGEILPIDASRMIQPSDGQTIDFAGRPLLFLDSPGHASHHHCIYDEQTNSVFTGDTLGLSYKALRTKDHAYMMPTTTPVQFNPEALHASIDKIMQLNPQVLYLTHYSAVRPTSRNIAGLHEQIEDFIGLTAQAAELDGDLQANLTPSLTEYAVQRALNELDGIDEASVRHWIKLDAGLNAQGLAFWWNHRRQA